MVSVDVKHHVYLPVASVEPLQLSICSSSRGCWNRKERTFTKKDRKNSPYSITHTHTQITEYFVHPIIAKRITPSFIHDIHMLTKLLKQKQATHALKHSTHTHRLSAHARMHRFSQACSQHTHTLTVHGLIYTHSQPEDEGQLAA